jgi:hypothetical protein
VEAFYFVFPDSHELSAKDIYMDAGEDNELDIDIVPIQTAHLTEKGMTYLQHYWGIEAGI